MSISYDIDTESGLVHVTNVGPTNLAEMTAGIDAIMVDPRLRRGLGVLCDWTAVEGVASMETAYAALRIATPMVKVLGPFRIAILVARPASYGIANAAQMYAKRLPGLEVCGFYDREVAEAWAREPHGEVAAERPDPASR